MNVRFWLLQRTIPQLIEWQEWAASVGPDLSESAADLLHRTKLLGAQRRLSR
jgi:hypothetical protein